MIKQKIIRRLNQNQKDLIKDLVNCTYNFLPLKSSYKSAVTFKTIFSESKISNYLINQGSKRDTLNRAFISLIKFHQRLPLSIFKKILVNSIEYRNRVRDPLTEKDVDEYARILNQLGFDLRDVISVSKLALSEIKSGEDFDKLIKLVETHPFDYRIFEEPLDLFLNGHYNESIRRAAENYESLIQNTTKLSSFGRDLMTNTFKDNTFLNIDHIQQQNRPSFIEGYRFITMGVMSGIRNVFSHGREMERSAEETLETLMLMNWLTRYL